MDTDSCNSCPDHNFMTIAVFNPRINQLEGTTMTWKKITLTVAMGIVGVGFGLAPATTNAGTEVIRDYGRDQFNSYAPAPRPPRPIYYAPPPPVALVVYPRPVFFGFGVHHRFYPRRYHHWR